MQPTMASSSRRILYDMPCNVCRDHSSGKHYGVYACDGCAGFFKRSVRRDRGYICKARVPGTCMIDKTHRNQCRFCRLTKCFQAGMNKDSVQHERGPRNSTLRRHMALLSKEMMPAPEMVPMNTQGYTMPEPLLPPAMPLPIPLFPNPFTYFSGLNLFHSPLAPSFTMPTLPISGHVLHGDDPEKQCEAAARLLFFNVNITKFIVPFETLSLSDRLILLEESWTEIFVLGVAEYMYPIDLNVIFERGWARIDRSDLEVFASVLFEINRLKPDIEEYMFLRSLTLFKTNSNIPTADADGTSTAHAPGRSLQDLPLLAEVQRRFEAALNLHAATKYPSDISRSSQLHHILSLLKRVSGRTIIELFFRNAIGDTTVERIISDMYQFGMIPVIPFNF